MFVTPGNHEDWGQLTARSAREPGGAVQLSRVVWVLPRGFRFTLGGHSWMSFGCAASVDREFRTEGVDWWAEEAPTGRDVEHAIAGGPVEVMLTHEAINGGTSTVENILATNPMGWPAAAMSYSAKSREKVTRVWDAVHPKVPAHGHFHVKGEIELPNSRRVYSLGCNGQNGNLALLNTRPWRRRRWPGRRHWRLLVTFPPRPAPLPRTRGQACWCWCCLSSCQFNNPAAVGVVGFRD